MDLICALHRRLMTGCYDETRYQKGERPGCFRLHDYVTGDGIGAAPEDVKSELSNLLNEMKAEEGRDYMALAVYDKTGKTDGFLSFLREQMVKTWEKKKKPAVKLNMLL